MRRCSCCGARGRPVLGLPVSTRLTLHAPTDGVVSVIAAEVGENVRAGQPILMVEASGKQWLSFNVREDHLSGLTVGQTVSLTRSGTKGAIKGVITELRPIGVFATWQAERVIGDHDRNTLRLRLDPQEQVSEPRAGHDRLDRGVRAASARARRDCPCSLFRSQLSNSHFFVIASARIPAA